MFRRFFLTSFSDNAICHCTNTDWYETIYLKSSHVEHICHVALLHWRILYRLMSGKFTSGYILFIRASIFEFTWSELYPFFNMTCNLNHLKIKVKNKNKTNTKGYWWTAYFYVECVVRYKFSIQSWYVAQQTH